jgi:hypothetical protein
MAAARTYRAGDTLEDYCRACKTDRMHSVVAADPAGVPLRVICGFCRSEHNYRGGPRLGSPETSPPAQANWPKASAPAVGDRGSRDETTPRGGVPIVSDRERSAPVMMIPEGSAGDLELMLRRVIREETGITPVAPAEKWRGGTLVLRPGTPGLQEKSWPIETFFHKVVMLRNRLRTLEQQVNASDLADDVKVKLQAYISGCYGSLTSFNILFADQDDQFKGSASDA